MDVAMSLMYRMKKVVDSVLPGFHEAEVYWWLKQIKTKGKDRN